MVKDDVYQRIRERTGSMSRAQKKIAAYIEHHPDAAPFLTAAKLAEKAGVGEATVVRFAVMLGFSGYTQMQQRLQEEMRQRVTTVERLDLAEDVYPEESRMAFEVMQDDMNNLQQTLNRLDAATFAEAVRRICGAREIKVVAFRSSHSLGYFLTFYLHLLLQNTELIDNSDTMFERLAGLEEEDLLIGIGFPRYTARTLQALQFSRSRGVPTLALTDSGASPLAGETDLCLFASSRLPSFVDSFTAPLSLVNGLLTAVGQTVKEQASQRLSKMEELWESEGIYHPGGE
ncbi:MurR/RpiR family transcriptional regulator [Kroppenstedtia eburnea]|uniref:Transcriptional regulator, RpiR family n=2 Tax=Kroppenstedtia TaxID=1274351 RepID=A0A1N7KW35_9BACL|nr:MULTISPECIES: MurR/RpiR family transcriptional regulator [Kroppenstedtia]QKI82783.1 MurR/RpiR family transcriptional regulator [Kroppenstedtia eburnea]GGA36846.1 N-acetylmannosamine kinase [Kroppenstedtia guangzhouensis]SIS65751.1 transcriptional regulator, RpiR family [Kroppenstedtia eburnea]